MISWGIIGCGDVTEKKSGPAFNKIKDSNLSAVMRRDASKAADYAHRHNVNKWYSDAYALINDDNVNAVYIATPPDSHEEYALAAINAGKSVYVEKPFTLDAPSARRIAEAAKKAGVKLSVAHYRRQMPMFKKIGQLLDENIIGNILSINLIFHQHGLSDTTNNWRLDPAKSGGGYFHDLAPHQLDLLLYFFKPPVVVHGISLNQSRLYNADDALSCTMLFENGALMTGLWCFTAPRSEQKDLIEIIGSEGSIRFSVFEMKKIEVRKADAVEIINFDPLEHVQQPMIEQVVEYFMGRAGNPCSGDEGQIVMSMIDSITSK